jgi:hypothetical protein
MMKKRLGRLTAGHQGFGWQLVAGRLISTDFLKFKAGIPS